MKVTFMPTFTQVEVASGTTVLEAIQQAGLEVDASCGGHGTCGKCKVQVTKGNKEDIGIRLACQCKVEEEMCVIVKNAEKKAEKKEKVEIQKEVTKQQTKTALGLAIDVGTTTVEIQMIELETKRVMVSERFMNPQRVYGADVIARITYCRTDIKRVHQLRGVLLAACNEVIGTMAEKVGVLPQWIEQVVMVSNTTMSHILAGVSVESLAKSPFAMEYKGGTTFNKEQLPLEISKTGTIQLLPNIGGHVGADTFGCIVALGLHKLEGTHLLMDIGTNGELALVKQGEITVCSTAAGPAFEGAGLAYGMCAAPGAITKVSNQMSLQVVGGSKPVGISGSGVIDAIAVLRKKGVIDASGYIEERHLAWDEKRDKKGVALYMAQREEESSVLLTREDVRQIQLAKGAIYAGAMSLLQIQKTTMEELDGLYLAGAFGSHLNVENAMEIGLLPKIKRTKVKEVGNAALLGAKQVLLGQCDENEKEEILRKTTHVELAEYDSFKEMFINAMNFS